MSNVATYKNHKRCKGCQKVKLKTEFYADRDGTHVDKLMSYCKPCSTERVDVYRRLAKARADARP